MPSYSTKTTTYRKGNVTVRHTSRRGPWGMYFLGPHRPPGERSAEWKLLGALALGVLVLGLLALVAAVWLIMAIVTALVVAVAAPVRAATGRRRRPYVLEQRLRTIVVRFGKARQFSPRGAGKTPVPVPGAGSPGGSRIPEVEAPPLTPSPQPAAGSRGRSGIPAAQRAEIAELYFPWENTGR